MCRYTMLISFSIFSSLLFCFTFSFLFSLCILGSPLLRDVYDPDEHTQVFNYIYEYECSLYRVYISS